MRKRAGGTFVEYHTYVSFEEVVTRWLEAPHPRWGEQYPDKVRNLLRNWVLADHITVRWPSRSAGTPIAQVSIGALTADHYNQGPEWSTTVLGSYKLSYPLPCHHRQPVRMEGGEVRRRTLSPRGRMTDAMRVRLCDPLLWLAGFMAVVLAIWVASREGIGGDSAIASLWELLVLLVFAVVWAVLIGAVLFGFREAVRLATWRDVSETTRSDRRRQWHEVATLTLGLGVLILVGAGSVLAAVVFLE